MSDENKSKAPTPHLTCIITGKTRPTNQEYLDNKATGPAGSVKAFMNNYVCKDAMKLLRQNPTVEGVEAIRKELGVDSTAPENWVAPEISANALKRIMHFNGKQKAATPPPLPNAEVKTESKPKAKARPSRAKKTTSLVEEPIEVEIPTESEVPAEV